MDQLRFSKVVSFILLKPNFFWNIDLKLGHQIPLQNSYEKSTYFALKKTEAFFYKLRA